MRMGHSIHCGQVNRLPALFAKFAHIFRSDIANVKTKAHMRCEAFRRNGTEMNSNKSLKPFDVEPHTHATLRTRFACRSEWATSNKIEIARAIKQFWHSFLTRSKRSIDVTLS